MKKTLLSAILALAMIVLLIPVSVSAVDGTPVSTVEEFESMVSGGTYYLANDIDFGGKQYECYILAEFSGVLNGNGCTIYNFTITNGEQESDVGIIKVAQQNGNLEINNLNIGKADQPIAITNSSTGKSTGAIAGKQYNGNSATFNGINIYANIKGTSAGKANVGGFVGYSRSATYTDCSFNGSAEIGSGLDQADEFYHNAAGFIGACNASTTFTNCENNGKITTYCSSIEARAAGFVSYTNSTLEFVNCHNNGDVTVEDCGLQLAASQCAGFVAHAAKTNVVMFENCVNYGRITASNWSAGFVANVTSGALFTTCSNEGEYRNDQAVACGPFVANVDEAAVVVDYEGECIDTIDPSVTWGSAETTTEAPTTTPAPVETTTEAPTTTPEPVVTTTEAPSTTPTPTTTTASQGGDDSSSGCGSVMISAGLVAVLGAGWLILRKKEN